MDMKQDNGRVKGFKVLEEECIWMKAGVVTFHLCDNAYDCRNCGFDKGMQKAMKTKGQQKVAGTVRPQWVDKLKSQYQGDSRPCRHALTGRVEAPKICTLNYECYHCSYDQMLDEIDITGIGSPPRYDMVSGYRMADGYYYHPGHNWVRVEHGGRTKVGFDDFMVRVFGAAERIELPPLGAVLKKDQPCLAFERGGNRAAVLSPVTGTVLAVNEQVRENPEITHADPYYQGWLFIVEPKMPKRILKGLYFGRESFKWMDQESHCLLSLMGPEYERLSATGGRPIGDFFGAFPEIGWEVLARTFLKTRQS